MASRDAEDAGDETTAGRERKTSSAGTSAADEPPPFAPPALDTAQAPWHAYGDVAAWEPEFRALASALDRGRALGEWNLAFAHLRAGARRALARCRAEQYARFAALLERLAEPEPSRDDTSRDTSRRDVQISSRALRLSTLREKLETTETDHAARILRVTFGRRAVAEKQLRRRRDGTRGEESARRGADAGGDAFLDENEDDDASLLAGESDMADPPTRAEMLAATRVLRGCWVHAPASCAAAGAAGAADALTRALEPVGAPPPPPRDSPSDLLQRALEQWHLDRESLDESKRNADGLSASDRHAPPLKVAFPEGRDSLDGDVAHAAVSIGWDVADPETAFGQPSPDSVRCEILEALLSLMARDGASCAAFVARGGVRVAAGYLLPWLAEDKDEAPGELVQRCIVFLGVLIRHVLPAHRDAGGPGGPGLAARAEATLEATIGAETTAEILEAAEDLHDIFAHEGDEGELWSENGDAGSEYGGSPYGVSPRRPASREGSVRRGSARSEG